MREAAGNLHSSLNSAARQVHDLKTAAQETAILLPALIACLEGDGRTIAQRRVRNPYRRS